MKKKILWAAGIFFAFVLIVLVGVSLLLNIYLKSERLKAIIIPKAEEFTGRKVSIDQIDVSIFKGIVVKGISLREKDSSKEFIRTKEFVLDYSLFSILKKQILIKKIEIISPHIFIKKKHDGRYNFDDIIESKKDKMGDRTAKEEKEKSFPLAIVTNRLSMKDATIEFIDEGKTIPNISANSDIEIRLSMGKDPKEIMASGYLNLKELKTTVNNIQILVSGKIEIDRQAIQMNLNTAMGKENLKLSGTVKEYMKSPDINLDLYAKELNLDKLMVPIGWAKNEKEMREGKDTIYKKRDKKQDRETYKIQASGGIKIDAARYNGYTIKDFIMNYRYKNNIMLIEPLSLYLTGGDKVNPEGVLKGRMQVSYEPGTTDVASEIKKTLTGEGSLDLKKCEVKESNITDAIALFTGLADLRRPHFESVKFNFNIKDQKVYLYGDMNSSQLRLNPQGTISFDQVIDVATDLKLSPLLTARIQAMKISEYIRDEEGWSTFPLKISGTIEEPSIGLNKPAVRKQIEKGIKEEIEKRLKSQDFFRELFGK